MNIVVLGDGLLGRTIFDILCQREKELMGSGYGTMLSHADFDIRDGSAIVRALKPHKPDVVINTVALHSLAACEADPRLAFDVNALGAARVARLVPTVYISTDYVFNDGGPHDEVMPGQRPRSAYGRSKFGGELDTLEQGGIIVRVAGLFGHHKSHKGPTFPETVLGSFAPVRFPNDQRFSPTYAPDAAERIVHLALRLAGYWSDDPNDGGVYPSGVYHAANSGSTTWAEFAENIAEVARFKRTITGYAAKDPLRPTNSALRSTRLPPLRHWRPALSVYDTERERLFLANRVSPLR